MSRGSWTRPWAGRNSTKIQDEDSRRRSVYFRQTPDSQMEFLKLFDAANPNECYERNESIVPQQALAMANSGLVHPSSSVGASSFPAGGWREIRQTEFIAAAFETVLGRPPSAKERTKSERFLREQADLFRSPERLTSFRAGSPGELKPAVEPVLRARENLVHALFNHNEFVTIR